MIEIIVRGTPAPQGSKTIGRHGGMRESSKAVKPWRERIASETQHVIDDDDCCPYTGPVRVRRWFLVRRPAGHYRTGRNAHLLRDSAPAFPATVKRNDIDKLARAVLDGITDGGAWTDDGQVVDLRVSKHYAVAGGMTGAKIEITEVAG